MELQHQTTTLIMNKPEWRESRSGALSRGLRVADCDRFVHASDMLELIGLRRRYGDVVALDGLTFTVQQSLRRRSSVPVWSLVVLGRGRVSADRGDSLPRQHIEPSRRTIRAR